jgi:hypothetical protein
MTNDNLYGFESSEEVKITQGLPIGTYKIMALKEEADPKGNGLIVEYEVVDGANKGARSRVWYNTLHENATTANIAKASLKRIADATGKPISQTSPIKGRVFSVTVGQQKNNPDYTEIKKYMPADKADAPF